jgi:ZIP family zinc transporter
MEKFYVWAIFSIGEPIAAVLGAFAVTFSHTILPYAGFCGRCHDFCGRRIPETQQDNNTDIATMGFVGDLLL